MKDNRQLHACRGQQCSLHKHGHTLATGEKYAITSEIKANAPGVKGTNGLRPIAQETGRASLRQSDSSLGTTPLEAHPVVSGIDKRGVV